MSLPHTFSITWNPDPMRKCYRKNGHFLANSIEGFDAISGVGQGDSSGPLCWIAVFDVLFCWTDARDPVTHPETLPEIEEATAPEDLDM
jgi:hypothetical protein